MGKIHKSSEYACWVSMRTRCNNPNHPKYKSYGARGIKVCERWDSFQNFIADMGLKPHPSLSLERKNNNEGYNPDNCKWGTTEEQSNNKRTSIIVTFRGETKTLRQHCTDQAMYNTVISRLWRGWDVQKALSEPRQGYRIGWPKGVKRKKPLSV